MSPQVGAIREPLFLGPPGTPERPTHRARTTRFSLVAGLPVRFHGVLLALSDAAAAPFLGIDGCVRCSTGAASRRSPCYRAAMIPIVAERAIAAANAK
jgi:hypothetical protein